MATNIHTNIEEQNLTPHVTHDNMIPTPCNMMPTPCKEKQRKYDELKAPLFNELKRTIAVKTVLQFSTVDLTVARQNAAEAKYYHGEGALVSQLGQFMTMSGNFGNIWATEDTEYGVLSVIP